MEVAGETDITEEADISEDHVKKAIKQPENTCRHAWKASPPKEVITNYVNGCVRFMTRCGH